jgi:hypothetical protein
LAPEGTEGWDEEEGYQANRWLYTTPNKDVNPPNVPNQIVTSLTPGACSLSDCLANICSKIGRALCEETLTGWRYVKDVGKVAKAGSEEWQGRKEANRRTEQDQGYKIWNRHGDM